MIIDGGVADELKTDDEVKPGASFRALFEGEAAEIPFVGVPTSRFVHAASSADEFVPVDGGFGGQAGPSLSQKSNRKRGNSVVSHVVDVASQLISDLFVRVALQPNKPPCSPFRGRNRNENRLLQPNLVHAVKNLCRNQYVFTSTRVSNNTRLKHLKQRTYVYDMMWSMLICCLTRVLFETHVDVNTY